MNNEASYDVLQTRLQAWAAWKHGGGLSSGFPVKSVLHESWSPPQPGNTPSMCVVVGQGDRRERQMDRLIARLSLRLQDTLVVVYLMRAGAVEQCERLSCQASTVRARVVQAKRMLARMLDAETRGN